MDSLLSNMGTRNDSLSPSSSIDSFLPSFPPLQCSIFLSFLLFLSSFLPPSSLCLPTFLPSSMGRNWNPSGTANGVTGLLKPSLLGTSVSPSFPLPCPPLDLGSFMSPPQKPNCVLRSDFEPWKFNGVTSAINLGRQEERVNALLVYFGRKRPLLSHPPSHPDL